jgi:single-stranded DNA-specific DHH superfamily exonuclease
MFDLLRAEARKAAELIMKHDFMRIFAHYDVDGISASAVLATSLLRAEKSFHITYIRNPANDELEYSSDELVVFQDMGSGYPEVISSIDADVLVIDHHFPYGKATPPKAFVHVNPHLAGLDGSFELSGSGTAYFVASELGENYDLTAIALLGIIGDKQQITAGNAQIVREGVERGYIEERKGLNMISGKLKDVLWLSTEPYFGFDDISEVDDFLSDIGLSGDLEFDELDEESEERLANAIAIRLLENNAYEGVFEQFIGKKYWLRQELVNNAFMMAEMVNACGRVSEHSIGLAICMRDERRLQKAYEIWLEFQKEVIEEIRRKKQEVQEGKCIRFLIMEDAPTTGPVASALSRYLFSDRPLIAVNIKNSIAKVSARSNARIAERIDLAAVMRIAAEKIGGSGGGHSVAAGATIPPDRVQEFIKEVDRLCCEFVSV